MQVDVETVRSTYMKYSLGDGYYLLAEQKMNGYGGYTDVNMRLYKGKELIRKITDKTGGFLDFPGIKRGDWEKKLTSPIQPVVRFVVCCSSFGQDGLALFTWMVQPDGRYWEDEYGFGAEEDEEICLCAKLNKAGRFVTPFMPERDMCGLTSLR